MGNLTRDARLLFILLWTIADDEGRLRGNPRYLAHALFPYDTDAEPQIHGWLKQLEQQDCIAQYHGPGGAYIQIINWKKHQKIDKPNPSRIAAAPARGQLRMQLPEVPTKASDRSH